MNWIPIDEEPERDDPREVVQGIVTDGNDFVRAVHNPARGWQWIKHHLVRPADATHYLIPELP